jgi:hypothetical protein
MGHRPCNTISTSVQHDLEYCDQCQHTRRALPVAVAAAAAVVAGRVPVQHAVAEGASLGAWAAQAAGKEAAELAFALCRAGRPGSVGRGRVAGEGAHL